MYTQVIQQRHLLNGQFGSLVTPRNHSLQCSILNFGRRPFHTTPARAADGHACLQGSPGPTVRQHVHALRVSFHHPPGLRAIAGTKKRVLRPLNFGRTPAAAAAGHPCSMQHAPINANLPYVGISNSDSHKSKSSSCASCRWQGAPRHPRKVVDPIYHLMLCVTWKHSSGGS